MVLPPSLTPTAEHTNTKVFPGIASMASQDSAAQLAVARQEVAAQRDAVAVAETEISQLRAAAEATTARRDQEYERERARCLF